MIFDYVVIGGGLVGLATSRELLKRRPGAGVVILEKEDRWASHQSSRNSGVIHAGVYYTPGSLKARLGVAGNASMIAFCQEQGIPHDQCGKLIVATDEAELPRMKDLQERATANGLQVKRIGPDEAREIEPHLNCVAALKVPTTGIVDFGDVGRVYAVLAADEGAQTQLESRVTGLHWDRDHYRIMTDNGELKTRFLVNCGGLFCDRIARMDGIDPGMRIVPFRGEYYEFVPERRHLVKNLIYPVPNPKFPFLGVHLTRLIDGAIHAGPNAVLAFSREGYRRSTVNLRDLAEALSFKGFWKLAGPYLGEGFKEVWRSVVKSAFVATVQRLVPEIRPDDLHPAEAGVRAQALRSDGSMLEDFHMLRTENALHVLNAPSPAETASLEIARVITNRVLEA